VRSRRRDARVAVGSPGRAGCLVRLLAVLDDRSTGGRKHRDAARAESLAGEPVALTGSRRLEPDRYVDEQSVGTAVGGKQVTYRFIKAVLEAIAVGPHRKPAARTTVDADDATGRLGSQP